MLPLYIVTIFHFFFILFLPGSNLISTKDVARYKDQPGDFESVALGVHLLDSHIIICTAIGTDCNNNTQKVYTL